MWRRSRLLGSLPRGRWNQRWRGSLRQGGYLLLYRRDQGSAAVWMGIFWREKSFLFTRRPSGSRDRVLLLSLFVCLFGIQIFRVIAKSCRYQRPYVHVLYGAYFRLGRNYDISRALPDMITIFPNHFTIVYGHKYVVAHSYCTTRTPSLL